VVFGCNPVTVEETWYVPNRILALGVARGREFVLVPQASQNWVGELFALTIPCTVTTEALGWRTEVATTNGALAADWLRSCAVAVDTASRIAVHARSDKPVRIFIVIVSSVFLPH